MPNVSVAWVGADWAGRDVAARTGGDVADTQGCGTDKGFAQRDIIDSIIWGTDIDNRRLHIDHTPGGQVKCLNAIFDSGTCASFAL